MSRAVKLIAVAGLTCCLAACKNFAFPGVHKIEIQQGNIVTQDMVNQLKPGMTKPQVRFVLGTPLIADSFHQNRWDYFYSLNDQESPEKRERISVFFADGKLTHFSGDFLPAGSKVSADDIGQ